MSYKIWKNLEQVERYANKRYRSWDQRWISEREQSLIVKLFRDNDLGGKILDVPSGFGRFNKILSEFGTVYAADLNHFAVEYYNQKVCPEPAAVEASANDLPFDDGLFDTVFSFRLLQHIHTAEDRTGILTELSRVSNNHVVASFYISNRMHLAHRAVVKMPSRITMISKAQLLDEARDAGLNLVTLISVIPGLHAHRIGLFAKK